MWQERDQKAGAPLGLQWSGSSLYEEGAAELLFKTVSMALRDGGLFVMACKERSNVNLPEELRYAEERGLGLRLVSGSPPEQYSSIIETYCFVKASKAHRPAS
eukprot:TRINITY_DN18784_c0_g1_i2.p2 TRINITY_DN18784_c0_g1~~TRINITY_DN18784_c0_g1_i2.p2  ORF type:complete len:103 (+),score=8.51 TRINITY_DN18784_c0_g1_i2:135-443(+)